MRWLLRDVILALPLTLVAFLGVMGLVGVLLALDTLRTQAFLGFTWGESLFVLLALAFVSVVLRLLYRLRFYENNKPNFEVTAAGVLGNLIRLRVRNNSRVPVGVSARGQVSGESTQTEQFILQWEETKENILQMNPGDHGTLRIGESLAIAPDGIVMHMVRFFSWRQGEEVEFNWGQHPATYGPVDLPFTLWLYPDKPSPEEYKWDYRLYDRHPETKFFLDPVPEPPSWSQRLKAKFS